MPVARRVGGGQDSYGHPDHDWLTPDRLEHLEPLPPRKVEIEDDQVRHDAVIFIERKDGLLAIDIAGQLVAEIARLQGFLSR
jgi:hypothetical protein